MKSAVEAEVTTEKTETCNLWLAIGRIGFLMINDVAAERWILISFICSIPVGLLWRCSPWLLSLQLSPTTVRILKSTKN